MAENKTSSSPLPANGKTLIRDAQWGIDNSLTGFIVQSEDYTYDLVSDSIQDQKGVVVS